MKSPYPSTQDPDYPRALKAELAELAADRNRPVHALLDARALDDALAPGTDPQLTRLGTQLALDLDDWLRTYDVSLNL